MNIGLIAHNAKKNLIEDFCVAYKRILEKHELYATGITGRRIEEATNLHVHKFLAGSVGGDKQFVEMIERNGLDMVIFFYSPLFTNSREPNIEMISKACDIYNIPIATNIATAESLVIGILLMIVGVALLFNPFGAVKMTMVFFGACLLIDGALDLLFLLIVL